MNRSSLINGIFRLRLIDLSTDFSPPFDTFAKEAFKPSRKNPNAGVCLPCPLQQQAPNGLREPQHRLPTTINTLLPSPFRPFLLPFLTAQASTCVGGCRLLPAYCFPSFGPEKPKPFFRRGGCQGRNTRRHEIRRLQSYRATTNRKSH